jgi:hypothetical protein
MGTEKISALSAHEKFISYPSNRLQICAIGYRYRHIRAIGQFAKLRYPHKDVYSFPSHRGLFFKVIQRLQEHLNE